MFQENFDENTPELDKKPIADTNGSEPYLASQLYDELQLEKLFLEKNGKTSSLPCEKKSKSVVSSVALEEDQENEAIEYRQEKPSRPWLSGGRAVLLGVGIGIGITLIGTRFLPFSGHKSVKSPAVEPMANVRVPAQSVTVAEVKTSRVNRTLKATGTVAAFEMTPVTSQATGLQIQQILVDEGDFVKAGQLLVKLDDSVLQAELTQAQAAVAEAEANLEKLRTGNRSEEIERAREQVRMAQAKLREAQQKLKELETGARREEIAQAAAKLAQAKGQVKVVMAQLKDTRVIAPVSGKIAERKARVGDLTSTSEKLFTIIENGRLELRVKVPETQLPLIRMGQSVEITSDVDSNLKLVGRVREIIPIVNEESRQATVEVDLPAQSGLKPGMFLRASITTSTATSLTTPMGAILPQADGSSIAYVLQENQTVKAQPVKTGELLSGDRIEIVEGLQAGDRVVVKGAAYLKDGDRISVISP